MDIPLMGCYQQAWALQIDMQITVFMPFVAVLFYNSKRMGYALCFAMILASWVANYCLVVEYDLKIAFMDAHMHNWLKAIVSKPYTRLSSIGLGCILASMYMDIKAYRKDPSSSPFWKFMHEKSWVGGALVTLGMGMIMILYFWCQPFSNMVVLATQAQN